MRHEELTRCVIGRSMRVHRVLGPGFAEHVYKTALQRELEEAGVHVEREVRLEVRYRHWVVGEHYADMIVGRCIVVEAKAVRAIVLEHEVQLVNYLTAVGMADGLLLNFGASRLQMRRKFGARRSQPERPPEDGE